MLTFEQIKELIELVSERGLQGVEIERSGFRLKIDGQPRKLDGKMRGVAIYYRDYKTENGLRAPRVLETLEDSLVLATHAAALRRVCRGGRAGTG